MRKYYVSRYMYAPEYYVGYLSGVAYLIRTAWIPKLLRASLSTPITHMDDVYMTGLLPRLVNLKPLNSPLFTYLRTEPDACLTKSVVSSFTNQTIRHSTRTVGNSLFDESRQAPSFLGPLT